ncbi:MAG: condensation domain-containing protein [Actinomycetota bacterium]
MTFESNLTFGQLSVWRSVQDDAPERASGSNVGTVTMLLGEDPARVINALKQLTGTTAGLRTSFRRVGNDLLQMEHTGVSPVVDVRDVSSTDPDELEHLRREMHSQAFTLTAGCLPWRATVMVRNGASVAVATTFHHLIADDWVLSAIERAVPLILAGKPVEFLTGPRELASEQSSPTWRQRQAMTSHRWSEMAGGAGLPFPTEHELSVGWTQLCDTTIDLGIPTAAMQRWSRDHDAFLSSTMLTVTLLIQAVLRERLQVSASLMSSNRFDPSLEHNFASLNQLTPISIQLDGSESFSALAQRVQDLSSEAYVLSCYDVDAMQRDLRLPMNPVQMDYWYNFSFSGQPPEIDHDVPAERADVITWAVTARVDGPLFYMSIKGHDYLQLTLRSSFALYPKDRVETLLLRLGETMRAIVNGRNLCVADVLERLRA